MNRAVVDAAHEMGVYVIVADRAGLDACPAMKVADEGWEIDFSDVGAIVRKAEHDGIDGVVNYCVNPAQMPYWEICQKLGLPCYGTMEQFSIMTDKVKFSRFCDSIGVKTVRRYSESEIAAGALDYPVLVKPAVARASRGQTVCRDGAALAEALDIARHTSGNGDALVEDYLGGEQDFALSCIVIDGVVFPLKAGDRYTGKASDNLDRQHIYTVSPSAQFDLFKEKTLPELQNLIDNLGYKFGPLFLQGFISQGLVRFYDPDLRFPGSDLVSALRYTSGFDAVKTMVAFALTGRGDRCFGDPATACTANSMPLGLLSVAVRPGVIATYEGFDDVACDDRVLFARKMAAVGDAIPPSGDVAQRVAEFVIRLKSREEMSDFVDFAYKVLRVSDSHGKDMIVSKLDFINGAPVVV